jgi:hypothetical protein
MEAWDIADDFFRRYSWWWWSSSPTHITMATTTYSNLDDDDNAVERQELQVWDKNGVDENIRSLLTLRHSHNPKSSPSRLFVGVVLLVLVIYAVVKMLSMEVTTFSTSKSEE